jgi:hypothetical protein
MWMKASPRERVGSLARLTVLATAGTVSAAAGTVLATVTTAQAAEKAPGYHFLKEIPIAGDTGWDYLSVDSEARRLYVTHGTHIVVIDLNSDAVVGDIADTPGVHGFALVPQLGRGFASDGADAKVSVVDLKTLATTPPGSARRRGLMGFFTSRGVRKSTPSMVGPTQLR